MHEYRTPFHLDDGFMELNDGGLLIVDYGKRLLLFDNNGRQRQCMSRIMTWPR